jgi:hypothetical protein
MQPNLLIFYNLFLKQKVKHCRRPERPYCRNCTDCFLTIKGDLISNECIDELAEDHLLVYRKSPLRTQEFVRKWGKGLSIEVVRQYISKINKTIREQILDGTLRQICVISSLRRYGESLYGVRIEKGKINITEKGNPWLNTQEEKADPRNVVIEMFRKRFCSGQESASNLLLSGS